MEGFKPYDGSCVDMGLGEIEQALPNKSFPLGTVHEVLSTGITDAAAASAFVACLLAPLIQAHGVAFWISSSRKVSPLALTQFGIRPDSVIFVDLKREREVLWAVEESLKCAALAAVVADVQEISFMASRRLQLAVEQSRVTGFLLRRDPRTIGATASVARWRISGLPSNDRLQPGMPGVSFPRWRIDLERIKNGKPGSWNLECVEGKFVVDQKIDATLKERNRRIG